MCHIWDAKRAKVIYPLTPPPEIKGINGVAKATEGCILQIGKLEVQGPIIEGAARSVVNPRSLMHTGGNLFMTETACVLCKDGGYTHMVPDGECFCLPCTDDDWSQHMEVHEGRVNSEAAMNECSRRAHTHHMKMCCMPKCDVCESCPQGRMSKGVGIKGPSAPEQELEVGFDIIGPLQSGVPDRNAFHFGTLFLIETKVH